MKVLHLADLHIGKRVNGFNMIEDQRFALEQILSIVKEEDIACILIAGDVYDQSVPSSEAMSIFDDFITSLTELEKDVLIIAGNHDSAERLAFASRLMQKSKVYISKVFDGEIDKIVLEDSYGPINFYLLPFLKPIHVKCFHPDLKLDDFQSAIDLVIESIDLDKSQRNVIISHQFIVGAERSDSEELYLGGSEAISLDTYKDFDYVALGHIHKKQAFRDGKVRYPGSLLKYSKSEANYKKAINIVDIRAKGDIEIIEKEISYLHEMREISGYFEDIIEASKDDPRKEDYIHFNLFDQDEVFDGLARLREVYPNLMTMAYVKEKEFEDLELVSFEMKEKDPFELFNEFYEFRKNRKLDEDKSELVKEVIRDVWGEL